MLSCFSAFCTQSTRCIHRVFEVILASEVLYDPSEAQEVANAAVQLLQGEARFESIGVSSSIDEYGTTSQKFGIRKRLKYEEICKLCCHSKQYQSSWQDPDWISNRFSLTNQLNNEKPLVV